jgi:hypothetical protein
MMIKLKLHLLDAGIIIKLFQLDLWDSFTTKFNIVVAETVVGEVIFFENDAGQKTPIDLQAYISDGIISCVAASPSGVSEFLSRFGYDYVERLDLGELESLAHMYSESGTIVICSADSIVFKVLGATDKSECGVSLEELLDQCGLGRKLDWKYSKAFREKYAHVGFQDRLQGFGPTP